MTRQDHEHTPGGRDPVPCPVAAAGPGGLRGADRRGSPQALPRRRGTAGGRAQPRSRRAVLKLCSSALVGALLTNADRPSRAPARPLGRAGVPGPRVLRPGRKDGLLEIRYDNRVVASGTIFTRTTGTPELMTRNFVVHGVKAEDDGHAWDPSWRPENRQSDRDVYADTTWVRVMVADAANYAQATRLAVQIPTAWSDAEIRFVVNTSPFGSLEGLWLFVIDRDNLVSPGFRLVAQPPRVLIEETFETNFVRVSGGDWSVRDGALRLERPVRAARPASESRSSGATIRGIPRMRRLHRAYAWEWLGAAWSWTWASLPCSASSSAWS
jgi:hypothetical protein